MKNLPVIIMSVLLMLCTGSELKAQAEQLSLESRVASLEKKSDIRFGMSIGWRKIPGKDYVDVFIDPVDSTLESGARDDESMILSAVVSIHPFRNRVDKLKNVGFIANVNIADIAGKDSFSVNNESIEGGFGVCYALSTSFSMGFTFERVFDHSVRSKMLKKHVGKKMIVDGHVLTKLDPNDARIFRKDDRDAFSFKFIYFL